jgi:hypothetical protein
MESERNVCVGKEKRHAWKRSVDQDVWVPMWKGKGNKRGRPERRGGEKG